MIDQITERLRREAMLEISKLKQKAIIEGLKTHKTHRMDIVINHCPANDEFIYSNENNRLEMRSSIEVEKIKPKGWVCPLP